MVGWVKLILTLGPLAIELYKSVRDLFKKKDNDCKK
jgi:hypothetical protein